jgi:hypothetical protein
VGLTTGPWEELSFASAGRGADPAPDSVPGAGRLVAGWTPQVNKLETDLPLKPSIASKNKIWNKNYAFVSEDMKTRRTVRA